jgi:hypothetical protein
MSACSEGRRGWFLPWTVAFGVMLGVGSPAQAESDEALQEWQGPHGGLALSRLWYVG